MNKALATLLIVMAGIGCQPNPEPAAAKEEQAAEGSAGVSVPEGDGSGIAIISPAAGGMSPVMGGENLQGSSAGSIGQAAKDKARDVASSPASSLESAGASDAPDGG